MHRQLVDWEEAMNHQSVAKWFSDFKPDRAGVTDSGGSGKTTTNIRESKARAGAAILDNRRVTVSELEHDLGLQSAVFRGYASTRFVRHGFREHYRKTTRHKEWLVLFHSSNSMPFMVMNSSNAFSLEARRDFTITPPRQNVQACSGKPPSPRNRTN
jgi:hypothetical protein